MSISIAVLDANPSQRNETLRMVDAYVGKRHLDANVDSYKSWSNMLAAVDHHISYNIYILETSLPETSGFFIARELRARDKRCKIIYYTENRAAAVQAFEVRADNYLLKPSSTEKFDKALDSAIADVENQQRSELITVKINTGYVHLLTDEIAYVNIVKRALCYHMRDGSIVRGLILRGPFRNAVANLNSLPMFRMIGASLLVNLDLVQVMSRTSILFNHGEWIMPPREAFSDLYQSWVQKNPLYPYS